MDSKNRLSVLTRHLVPSAPLALLPSSPNYMSVLETVPTSAEVRLAPGGGKGTVTLLDNRTGRNYEFDVSEDGTLRASDFKKVTAGGDGMGLKLYDPGYLNTAPVRSSICFIDGDKGILRYRGYPIEQLAEKSTFLETAYLLLYGSLPTSDQLSDWDATVMQHSAVPEGVLAVINALPHDAHPMGTLVGALSALGAFHADANPALQGGELYQSAAVRDKQIVRVLGKVPTIAAAAYLRMAGRSPVPPLPHLSYAENFLYMLDSFGVDVYTVLAGATGALYGPLHGGANEAVLRMLSEIGIVDKIPEFIQGVKNRKRKMSGFGHRVYKNYDPRAKVIRGLAEEVFSIVGRDPLIEVAVALEQAALSDEYFITRKLYPNVDFYSGLIYRALGFPTEFFPVLFAIPRMAGYLAHWKESLDDPDTKIARPQECYTGVWYRNYVPISQRSNPAPDADKLGQIAVSNATKRRMAAVAAS